MTAIERAIRAMQLIGAIMTNCPQKTNEIKKALEEFEEEIRQDERDKELLKLIP